MDVKERAKKIFLKHKKLIHEKVICADIQHVGGTAMKGVDTKGDVDIAVRIENSDFEKSKKIITELYSPKNPEIWTHYFALFHTTDDLPIDILLVIKNSPWDTYCYVRDLLNSNQHLVLELNEIKKLNKHKGQDTYLAAKESFFSRFVSEGKKDKKRKQEK